MANNDFPSIDIEKLIELWKQEKCLWNIRLDFRSVQQEDLKENPLDNFVLLSKHHVDKGSMHICMILAGKSYR